MLTVQHHFRSYKVKTGQVPVFNVAEIIIASDPRSTITFGDIKKRVEEIWPLRH